MSIIEYSSGKPTEQGVYACRVPENGLLFWRDLFLVWHAGEWCYPMSDQKYRDDVPFFLGPLRRRMPETPEMPAPTNTERGSVTAEQALEALERLIAKPTTGDCTTLRSYIKSTRAPQPSVSAAEGVTDAMVQAAQTAAMKNAEEGFRRRYKMKNVDAFFHEWGISDDDMRAALVAAQQEGKTS